MAGRTGRMDGRTRRELGGLVAVVVLVRVVLGLVADGPHLFPDEIGYLGAARHLAGAEPEIALGPVPLYYPLYSIVLAPIAALGLGPSAMFSVVMVVNALLGGAVVVLVYGAGRRILDATHRPALGAAAVAAAFPGQLLTTQAAWAESLFVIGFLAAALAVHRWAERPSMGRLVAVIVSATACYWTHPRGVLVVGGAAVAGVALAARRTAPWSHAVTAAVALVGSFVASRHLIAALLDPLYTTTSLALQDDEAPRRLTDVGDWPDILRRALGASWYQITATLGLVVVGVLALGRRARDLDRPAGLAAAFVLVVTVAAVLGSALFHEGARADTYFYGRYVDSVAPLVLGAGCLELLRADRPRRQRLLVTMAAATVATTLLFAVVAPDLDAMPLVPDMVLGLVGTIGVVGGPTPIAIGAVSLVVLAVTGLVGRRRPGAGLALVTVAFLSLAIVGRAVELDDGFDAAGSVRSFAGDVAALSGGAPVAMDLAEAAVRPDWLGYQWFEPDLAVVDVDETSGVGGPEWLIGTFRWPFVLDRGARLVAVDPSFDAALYVQPGTRQDELVALGAVLPDDFPSRLDAGALRAELDGPREVQVASGDSVRVTIEVRHAGTGQRWPRYRPAAGGFDGARVRVGARLRTTIDRDDVVSMADLPHDLLPGGSATVRLELRAVDAAGNPLAPGRYRAFVDVQQVGYGWFSEIGRSAPFPIDLVVGP